MPSLAGKNRYIRIGSHLQRSDAGREDNDAERKSGNEGALAAGINEHRSHAHSEEAGNHGALVADPLDDFARGKGEGRVRAKKAN